MKDNNLSKGKISEEAVRGNIKDSLLTKQFNMDFLKQLKESADAEQGIMTTKPNGK
jgi:hypothetical protein